MQAFEICLKLILFNEKNIAVEDEHLKSDRNKNKLKKFLTRKLINLILNLISQCSSMVEQVICNH